VVQILTWNLGADIGCECFTWPDLAFGTLLLITSFRLDALRLHSGMAIPYLAQLPSLTVSFAESGHRSSPMILRSFKQDRAIYVLSLGHTCCSDLVNQSHGAHRFAKCGYRSYHHLLDNCHVRLCLALILLLRGLQAKIMSGAVGMCQYMMLTRLCHSPIPSKAQAHASYDM
jgi:hypothetical protein